jgi:hypothetical protein
MGWIVRPNRVPVVLITHHECCRLSRLDAGNRTHAAGDEAGAGANRRTDTQSPLIRNGHGGTLSRSSATLTTAHAVIADSDAPLSLPESC